MSRPVLPRFETTVLKPTAAGQEPAAATITFRLRGATVIDGDTLPPGQQNYPVSVSDSGDLAAGDVVQVGSGPATLDVSSVSSANQVALSNSSASSVVLDPGVKLSVVNREPAVYSHPLGAGTAINSIATDATTGRASTFLQANRVDYEVSISGEPTRFYSAAAGRMGRSNQRWNDLRDFGGSLERALDALPDSGGVIFVPRGEWLIPNPITVLKDGVRIIGEGFASVLKAGPGMTADLITVERPFFHMRDLTVDGAAAEHDPDGACGVVVRGIGFSGLLVLGVFFDNVRFTRAARNGLFLRDVIVTRVQNCEFDANLGNGAQVETPGITEPGGVTTIQFIGCTFTNNGVYNEADGVDYLTGRGCVLKSCVAILFSGCSFDGNSGGFYPAGDNDYLGNAIQAESIIQLQVQSCTFRNPRTPVTPGHFVALGSCLSSLVDACYFDGGPDTATSKPPKGGVAFNNSGLSRVSSCTGLRLVEHLAWFDSVSRNGVEFGNTEVEQSSAGAPARLRTDADALGLIGMSRRALSSPDIIEPPSIPSSQDVLPGALLWRNATIELLTWDGASWRVVTFQP